MKVLLILVAGIILGSLVFSVGYSDELIFLGNGNAPFYMSNSDNGRFDLNNDENADYYVKAHYTGNSHQKLKIDYKIQDECVDFGPKDPSDVGGDTFEDAVMKVGLNSMENEAWIIDDVTVSNPWFNSPKNDNNKQIDLVSSSKIDYSTKLPTSGDDVIQTNGKKGSFKHFDSISELNGQSGWEGTIFLNAPAGNYYFVTFHPAGGLGGCDQLSGFGIPIFITD